MRTRRRVWRFGWALGLAAIGWSAAAQQTDLGFERARMKLILDDVARQIEKNFHDPTLRGLDWKALAEQARQNIHRANSAGEMMTAIFSMVDKLKDSHTLFIPPARVNKIEFGFDAKAYGDQIRIYEVKKDGPAAAAGLRVGDQILTVNDYRAQRDNFDLMMLYFHRLRPVPALDIVYARGDQMRQRVVVTAKVSPGQVVEDLTSLDTIYKYIREAEREREEFTYHSYPDGIGYVHLPSFTGEADFYNRLIGKIKKSRAVVVDLRGNPGGALDTLSTFAGYFEAQPTVVADMVGRKKTEPIKVKPRSPSLSVPLVILVDSQTGSAAEIFARHVQRTGRGVVVGDRTAGRVTASKVIPGQVGADVAVLFAVQVAIARVVFPGGEELESKGVTPDHACLPTQAQLLEGQDPCQALGLSLARKALGLPEQPAEEKSSEKPN